MKIIVKTKELSREEWLKYRRCGIGGSDVSIIAGINPFKSAYQLWMEKTGQAEPEQTDSDFAHFGTLLEPIVRKEFTARTGIKVRRRHAILQSEEHPFMIADLDGVINENGRMAVFEAKTASAYKQEVWENGIPAAYMLQVQHYMAVTGAGKTYIAALVGGNRFFCHEVIRDDGMIAKITAMEQHFWEDHVVKGIEPPPDGSEATTAYFNEKFAVSNGKTIELPEAALQACERYEQLAEQVKRLETEKNAVGNQLKGYMKENEVGIVGGRKVTWRPISKSMIDSRKLRDEKPDIYNAYLSTTSYRRLLVA